MPVKFLASLVFAAALLVPALAAAQTVATNTAGDGFPCQKNDDCVKIDNNCGGAVVNRQSFDDFEPLAENMECTPHVPSWPEEVAQCYQGTCIIVRLSEKDFEKEWYKCGDEDTCVVAYDGCQDFAVNGTYIKDVKKKIMLKQQCTGTSLPHNSQLVGKCVKNTCTLAPRDPNE